MLNVPIFPCPSCHEFISSSMTVCKYCSVPIDPQAATTAVELQDKVNRACNDASLVRNLAGAMWVLFCPSYSVLRVGGEHRDVPPFPFTASTANYVAS